MIRIAVVVGGADGQWAEWEEACALIREAGAEIVHIAVSGAGMEYPDPLHHWCTQHPIDFGPAGLDFERRREENGLGGGYVRWSLSRHHLVDRTVRSKEYRGGSSGLTGFDAGLHGVGCDGVLGCGVRMDATPNRYNPRAVKGWRNPHAHQPTWEALPPSERARMRSMSGWTRDLLGAPTVEWIKGLRQRAAA